MMKLAFPFTAACLVKWETHADPCLVPSASAVNLKRHLKRQQRMQGEVDEKIEAQFRLGELADLGNSRGVQQFQRQLTAKFHRAEDDPLELLLERFGQLFRGHSGLR